MLYFQIFTLQLCLKITAATHRVSPSNIRFVITFPVSELLSPSQYIYKSQNE
jgi:hypothetical protein